MTNYEDYVNRQAVKELPDKLEGHDRELTNQTDWIPVSERLPEEPGHYLVTMKQGYISFIQIIWYDRDDHMDDFWRNHSNIIAWMPLPEPYKEESEEE